MPHRCLNSRNLIHITRLTGQRYEDAYAVWQRFHKLPESYAITYAVLCIAQQQGIPVDLALTYYLDHLQPSQR